MHPLKIVTVFEEINNTITAALAATATAAASPDLEAFWWELVLQSYWQAHPEVSLPALLEKSSAEILFESGYTGTFEEKTYAVS